MGKWIVQKMPENPPAKMPHVELECRGCGYRVRHQPGFDPYQPVATRGLECPFCPGHLLVRHVEPGTQGEYLVADCAGVGVVLTATPLDPELEEASRLMARAAARQEDKILLNALGAPDAQDHAEEDGPEEGDEGRDVHPRGRPADRLQR